MDKEEKKVLNRQVTELLPNAVLGRLERLRLNPIRRNTNKHRGEHLSGRGGTSTEFSDYRDYAPGDDTRFIDWNIYSRLRRPYMKQFHMEEEMHIVIIIDASSSMRFEGKLELAQKIAAAFGLMGLYGTERVSVYSLAGDNEKLMPDVMPPARGRTGTGKLFSFINSIECGGNIPFSDGIEKVLKYHKGKGSVILLSDFLSYGDFSRSFNLLFSSGLEIFAVQILSPSEIDPELTGDLRFIDCENGANLDISSAGGLLSLYQEHRLAFEAELAKSCTQRSGRFMSMGSDTPIETVIFDKFLRRGWIK